MAQSATTAAATASIAIAPICTPAAPSVDVIERYRRWFTRLEPPLFDDWFETPFISAKPFQPAWLKATQTSIRNSVARSSAANVTEGRWLTQDVANAATDFLETTADLLPGRPFVYSSKEGDFVAEFQSKHGSLTSIVSPAFVLLFATVDGVPFERKVTDARTLREEVRRLMEPLLRGQHGDLETAK